MSTFTHNSDGRVGGMIATYWVQGFFAILVVGLRMWARKLTKQVWWDDWLMVLCLIFYLTFAGLVTYSALIGGFGHLAALSPPEEREVLKWNYAYQVVGSWTLTPGKASVAVLIYRIVKPLRGWEFWTLVTTTCILAAVNTINDVLTYVQCDPAEALWDKSIKDANCWPPSVQTDFAFMTASLNVFTDFLLAGLPAIIFFRLNITLRQKIGLTMICGLGIVAGIVGAVKTAGLANLAARSDLTWEFYKLIILTGTELWLVIIAGSIPPIKPLWTIYFAHPTSKVSSLRSNSNPQRSTDEEIASRDSKTSVLSSTHHRNTSGGLDFRS